MWHKQRYFWQLQNHVWITNFRGRNRKTTMLGKCEYLFVVLRYGMSCQEMCGMILWVGKQDDSATLQSIHSMHWWPSFQRRRMKICRRSVESIISNCSEMFVFGTYWKTWCSMVSDQTCTVHLNMVWSMWQTIESFNILHPSYLWLQTVLSCWKHCKTMQIGTASRFRFCGRPSGLKIHFGWNIVRLWKSYICSNKLDA